MNTDTALAHVEPWQRYALILETEHHLQFLTPLGKPSDITWCWTSVIHEPREDWLVLGRELPRFLAIARADYPDARFRVIRWDEVNTAKLRCFG